MDIALDTKNKYTPMGTADNPPNIVDLASCNFAEEFTRGTGDAVLYK